MGLFSRVTRRGELLPILWNVDWGLDLLPHQEVIPDQLFVTLARVRLSDGRLSIDRVTQNEIDQKGVSFEDLLAKAHANQRKGLRVDQTDTGEGELLVLHRNSTPVSGALTLPDFHAQMSQAVGAESLVVAIPNPEEVAVAAEGSPPARKLEEMIRSASQLTAELVPTLLRLEPDGITVIAMGEAGPPGS